ncbi:iron ABC transporter permease [Bacillus sp. B15-48]|uniref:FecCD family ABC transporter permease n=1 Tax=Bacillus sp. B15-48 TaxID=1548601 RepID=UPI00193F0E5F|nr:iron ABC transporter permease [Bacillus sp. B15-48]MBM4763596.1 iron chelate uptake ABC transporter family permease subunit [Bacillus sp. B15-48]
MSHLSAARKTNKNKRLTLVAGSIGREKNIRKHARRFNLLLFSLIIGLFLSITLSIMLGPVPIHAVTVWKIALSHIPVLGEMITEDWTSAQRNIIWEIRFPRVLLGATVGAGLALVGAAIQALVRNSLADPYILGVSSGASVGATLVILFGAFSLFGVYALSVAAFLGALLSVVLVFFLAQVGGRISTIRLLLAGIAISMILSALTNFIVISAPDEEGIRSAMFWMMGSLTGAKWESLPVAVIAVIGTFIFLTFQSRSLNLLLMGEDTAATLGININVFRKILIVVTALLTGVLVAVSGAIGFVGLMVPHIVRLLVGSDHKRVLPISLLFGAVFMIWADVVARLIVAPEELPIGIVTALCGGPFFIWLLRKSSYTFGGHS